MFTDIVHDSRDGLYRLPGGAVPAGSRVCLRLWAGRRLARAVLRIWTGSETLIDMREAGAYRGGALYEAVFDAPAQPGLCWYFFIVDDGERTMRYGNADDRLGGLGQLYAEEPPSFQITVYDGAFMPPEWLRDGVIYQIFPDRFNRTDIGADGRLPRKGLHGRPAYHEDKPVLHSNWYSAPRFKISRNGDNAANDFFGGTLAGIEKKLDYLKAMGVSVLYLNPIFMSPSNHRYNCADYSRVDPMLGDEAALKSLCSAAQQRGIRVMLDGVFSHTGDDSVYFDRYGTFGGAGACKGKDSPYFSWFKFEDFPTRYKSWWDFDTLPEVDKDAPGYRRFICGAAANSSAPNNAELSAAEPREGENDSAAAEAVPDPAARESWPSEGIVRHYLRCGVSGWRLDVADELPMDFIRELRSAALTEKPDAALIGEVWEDASNKIAYGKLRCYFTGDTLDSVMDYPLRDMAIDFFLGRCTAAQFARRYMALCENYPKPALHALMNLIGSHDRARILNLMAGLDPAMPRTQQAKAQIPPYMRGIAQRRVAALWRLICALPGAPCIYYGDEAGCAGMSDPFNRGTYPWGREDKYLLGEFGAAAREHSASPLLKRGDVDVQALCDDVLLIRRSFSGGCDYSGAPRADASRLVLVNRSIDSVTVCVDAALLPEAVAANAHNGIAEYEVPGIAALYIGEG